MSATVNVSSAFQRLAITDLAPASRKARSRLAIPSWPSNLPLGGRFPTAAATSPQLKEESARPKVTGSKLPILSVLASHPSHKHVACIRHGARLVGVLKDMNGYLITCVCENLALALKEEIGCASIVSRLK